MKKLMKLRIIDFIFISKWIFFQLLEYSSNGFNNILITIFILLQQ